MVYKRFRIVLAGRVLLLGGFIFLLYFLILQTSYYAATLIVAALIVYQFTSLIAYVEKTNRDLTRFLDAIKYSDFSQTFAHTGLGSSFTELKAAFNEVIEKFQKTRAAQEEHFRYLQTVVQHVGIGLIAFNSEGEVSLLNNAAKRLLNVSHLKNIKSLAGSSEKLVEALFRLTSGQKALIKLKQHDQLMQLAVYATEFKLQHQRYTLVSLQNIGAELEEQEMEAWQKLIRVLTHEIMNSITPISSLASTANELLKDVVANGEAGDSLDDIGNALQTIRNRSEGLSNFVDAYRNLTRIPRPNFQIFPIQGLFERITMLMRTQAAAGKVDLRSEIRPASLELTADPELVEQVLINLAFNAIQAVAEQLDARVILSARMDERGRVLIQVEDNGPGILPEVLDKIFIPFFTTKKGGSGIGLSLSRQIMRLHRGTISVQSEINTRTVFTLRF
ncbi:MAG: ATP-binding protein [Calditrichaeota bacterium]|nr:ATP-binding protein [Calditrichota bacterium]